MNPAPPTLSRGRGRPRGSTNKPSSSTTVVGASSNKTTQRTTATGASKSGANKVPAKIADKYKNIRARTDSNLRSAALVKTKATEQVEVKEGRLRINSSTKKSKKGAECSICFEIYSKVGEHAAEALNCGHVFCAKCMSESIMETRSCPKCRKAIEYVLPLYY